MNLSYKESICNFVCWEQRHTKCQLRKEASLSLPNCSAPGLYLLNELQRLRKIYNRFVAVRVTKNIPLSPCHLFKRQNLKTASRAPTPTPMKSYNLTMRDTSSATHRQQAGDVSLQQTYLKEQQLSVKRPSRSAKLKRSGRMQSSQCISPGAKTSREHFWI